MFKIYKNSTNHRAPYGHQSETYSGCLPSLPMHIFPSALVMISLNTA